ncbi:hypothetical protein DID78_04480 [Candidatus Marinamargulisbacteria bacterium SCGC AG-343-D04]|nr:hypothetical protein DID78_04480 [Candidatus Marinamargulisbacteria bacterium SCGC AG-343-D04]
MWVQGVNITKVTDKKKRKQIDHLILEKESTLYFNDDLITTLVHTPQLEKELGLGYLLSHGYSVMNSDSFSFKDSSIRVNSSEEKAVFLKHSTIDRLDSSIVFSLTAFFQEAALLFKQTAISESAAIADDKTLLYKAEDLYQSNAFYKVLGQAVVQNESTFHDKILLLSAKCDSQLMKLCCRFHFKAILTRTAPTFQAVQMANDANILLIGFARGKRFNLYNKK